MNTLILVLVLAFLITMAIRNHNVILIAPLAAVLAVLLTDPIAVAPAFTQVYMPKLAEFMSKYFPIFLLGAVFGKLVEISGFASAIAEVITGIGKTVTRITRLKVAALSIAVLAVVLTFCGVSLFVAVFAVAPVARRVFQDHNVPYRLIPCAIALGAFTFTMDALPATPQIQNLIPTEYFHTTSTAAPILGLIGSFFIFVVGGSYLEWQRYRLNKRGLGYHDGTAKASDSPTSGGNFFLDPALDYTPRKVTAAIPLVAVPLLTWQLTSPLKQLYGTTYTLSLPFLAAPLRFDINNSMASTWALDGALVVGIVLTFLLGYRNIRHHYHEAAEKAVGGALQASMNTASEYGFGSVMASLPGIAPVRAGVHWFADPLKNIAATVTLLAGMTGSASGGLRIALSALSSSFISTATGAGIPLEVLHRVCSMASGGMDTLPQNGAVITVLRQCEFKGVLTPYLHILALTVIKTVAVFVVIAVYRTFNLY